MQTKKGSFVEASTNIVIGYTINFAANLLIFPLFGYPLSARDAFWIGVLFTVISVVRQYILRRWFNRIKAAWNHHHEH